MEGQVYVCSWRRKGGRIEAWLEDRPELRGEGATFRQASASLHEQIAKAFDDGEALLEFQPPAPDEPGARRFLHPPLVWVVGNTRALLTNADELFTEGLCPRCRQPRGNRTAADTAVDYIEPGYDGGFTHPARRMFFSEAFLSLLTREERERFQWRPVRRPGRTRKAYLEMIAAPDVPLVAVRGLDFPAPTPCRTCGQPPVPRHFGRDLTLHEFVCRADLPQPLPTCLTMGIRHDCSLFFPRERWQQMVGRPGARGLVTNDVGVADPAECLRTR
jgi:hypothetical protein